MRISDSFLALVLLVIVATAIAIAVSIVLRAPSGADVRATPEVGVVASATELRDGADRGEPAQAPGSRRAPSDVRNRTSTDDSTPARRVRVTPPATLDLLTDAASWRAAGADDRRRTAERVAADVAGFSLRGVDRTETTGGTVELATFTHAESGLEFVLVPAGSFWMGSPPDEPGRGRAEARHHVTLTTPFLMARTEVSQEVWRRVMGSNPTRYDKGAKRPVTHVSWNESLAFCERLGLDLPTEAQWEYACRAGSEARFSSGAADVDLERVAWFDANSGGHAHPVGLKVPNEYGLHDMHGNVLEWCRDGFGEYGPESVTDPELGKGSTQRVRRGGSWKLGAERARCADRLPVGPSSRSHHGGFRPVRVIPID